MGTVMIRSRCNFLVLNLQNKKLRKGNFLQVCHWSKIKGKKLNSRRKLIDESFQYPFSMLSNSWEAGSSTHITVDYQVDITPVLWKEGLNGQRGTLKVYKVNIHLTQSLANSTVWMLGMKEEPVLCMPIWFNEAILLYSSD